MNKCLADFPAQRSQRPRICILSGFKFLKLFMELSCEELEGLLLSLFFPRSLRSLWWKISQALPNSTILYHLKLLVCYHRSNLSDKSNMKNITIAERRLPYRHIPGTFCIIPGTALCAEIFPTLIHLYDLTKKQPARIREIPVPINGPVRDFTVQQDLEKGNICVWGHSKEGYFRYRLLPTIEGGIALRSEKLLSFETENDEPAAPPPHTDRLSLGNNKAQNWSLIESRQDMAEVFPHWLRLGQLVPSFTYEKEESSLLKKCEQAINEKDRIHVLNHFTNLFLASFKGILTPQLFDDRFQGLGTIAYAASPLVILSEGALLIRSLFVQQTAHEIFILPVLPPEFHSGRLLNISCGKVGDLSLEWSKKFIRRMILVSESNTMINPVFQKEIKSFRLKKGSQDRGVVIKVNTPIDLEQGCTYYFDRYMT